MLGQRFVDWASFFHMHHLVTYVVWSRVETLTHLKLWGGGGGGQRDTTLSEWIFILYI